MKVLVYTKDCLAEDMSREEKIKELADILSSAYDDATADSEAYVAAEHIEDNDLVLGAEAPKTILDAADHWNESIVEELEAAIDEYRKATPSDGRHLKLDNSITYRLKKAAMAADNSFYCFADKATYLPRHGSTFFRTVLEMDDIQAIHFAPENYAIIDIPVK